MTNNWKKYIFWFAQEHVDFRLAEMESLMKLFNIPSKDIVKIPQNPYWIVELPDENAAKILASRSVSLRCILELWSYADNTQNMHENVRNYLKENKETETYFYPEKSFKITVETYNKHFTLQQKIEKIETFDYLPLKANVNLKNPDVEWWYIEFYGLDPLDVQLKQVLFGRWIVDGQRNLIKELSLKKRKFIGNTSMDAQLSILMANQGLIKFGDLVYDPFVGTGSLLVSAAKFGGYVLGADIDYMMIHARSRPSRITQKVREKDESIRANLKQYHCEKQYLDVLVSDFSNSIWRDELQFDCIITDPPYGIRESTERVQTKHNNNQRELGVPHYPSTSHYSLNSIYNDLLKFASKHLRLNGRLVCWFPFNIDDYSEKIVPCHKNLILIANSEQTLSAHTSRRLLTYEKINNEIVIDDDSENNVKFIDFRQRYFHHSEETRQERRLQKAQLKENGKLEAIKRGKKLDINGKVINR